MTSVLMLVGLTLSAPDHTTVSRHAVALPVMQPASVPPGPLHVLIDSTGQQVYGAGQRLEAKHGAKSRRTWTASMSEARAVVNMIGSAVATVVMARLEGKLDRNQLRLALDGQPPDPSDLPAELGTATVAEQGAVAVFRRSRHAPARLVSARRVREGVGMTWSILARDSATGALGAAVASRFFAVGGLCIHVEGGVAALATQALVNPMYAVHAMPRLREGAASESVLATLVGPDPGRAQRQLHILDASGRIAQHTGPDCVSWAGHIRGAAVSVAGNMLAGPDVVARTLDGFIAARGSLAERLLAAIEAGEAAGGDKRGRQGAGLKICLADPYPDLDIRADDHPDPLAELRRLHRISLERYAVFRRHLAGSGDPWGTLDRSVVDAAIARDGQPL